MNILYNLKNCIDVALFKPAFQSSLSHWSSELGARQALLPDAIDSDFSFHTSKEIDPWWMVDLICSYPIEYVVIYGRTNFCDITKTLKIEISNDANR